MMKLNCIARCVWFCDTKLYHRLLGSNHTSPSSPISELALKHLTLADSKPTITNLEVFEEKYRLAKIAKLEEDRRCINFEYVQNREISFCRAFQKEIKIASRQ